MSYSNKNIFAAKNNSIMSTIIFLSIAIILIAVMLVIRINIFLDFKALILRIKIKVFFIKIVEINLDLLTLKYRVNKSKKEKQVNLFINKEQEYLILQIKKSILDKLYYDDLSLNTCIGVQDAALTANIVGSIDLICRIFKTFISVQRHSLDFRFSNTAEFVNESNQVTINLKVYFTIFDMIFALIMSFYKRGRYVKQKR